MSGGNHVIERWGERVRSAAASGTALRLTGGGTKDFYGQQLVGYAFDTTEYAGIVDYDPTELVITARCGTPLAEVEAALAEESQMFAFEPPGFGPTATLGGCIASGLSGPRRAYAAALRDAMLGVRVLDGRGEDLSFGGRVMKNVAGFDVSRLMAGSLGTLGIILEASLKCLPLPKSEATRVFELGADQAVRQINEWTGQPLPLSASCYYRGACIFASPGRRARSRRLPSALPVPRSTRPMHFGPRCANRLTNSSQAARARRPCGASRSNRPRLMPISAGSSCSNGEARCAGSSCP